MGSCCDEKSCELEKMSKAQSKVLWTVLGINLTMFFVEITAGAYANSLALTGDSLDMLGDAVAYGASLYVVNLGQAAKATAAMLKGWIILASAVAVLGAAVYRTFFREVPVFEIMSIVGVIALVANLICLALLNRHRNADINMASVWLCSRNDIIANISVLIAAVLVLWTGTTWPDLVIGIALTVLFTRSALHIFSESRRELNPAKADDFCTADGDAVT